MLANADGGTRAGTRPGNTMILIFRVLLMLVLLAIAAFCLFGFLATFEPPQYPGWRVAYGTVGVICIIGAIGVMLVPHRRA